MGAALLGDRPQVRLRPGRPVYERQARPDHGGKVFHELRLGVAGRARRLLRARRRRPRLRRDPHRRRAGAQPSVPRRLAIGTELRGPRPRRRCADADATVDFGLLGPNARRFTYRAAGSDHTVSPLGGVGAYLVVQKHINPVIREAGFHHRDPSSTSPARPSRTSRSTRPRRSSGASTTPTAVPGARHRHASARATRRPDTSRSPARGRRRPRAPSGLRHARRPRDPRPLPRAPSGHRRPQRLRHRVAPPSQRRSRPRLLAQRPGRRLVRTTVGPLRPAPGGYRIVVRYRTVSARRAPRRPRLPRTTRGADDGQRALTLRTARSEDSVAQNAENL